MKKQGFILEYIGDICRASGNNFEYYKLGNKQKFIQKGKIPSLRIIKTIIKNLLKVP